MSALLNDCEDDFFYEEDKIVESSKTQESRKNKNKSLLSFDGVDETSTTNTHKLLNAADTQQQQDLLQQRELQKQPQQHLHQLNKKLIRGQSSQMSTEEGNIYENNFERFAGYNNDDESAVMLSYSIYDKFNDIDRQKFELERLGMTTSTRSVFITKDESNLIGISIGGGAPLCPCLYIVQVFDGTPAALDGNLESGDELLAVNNASVKGKTKVEVAKMIQAATEKVTIHYNKLHADPEQGKSLDIIFKKLKHRIVDSMSSSTADTLGLSRAILCSDTLVKRLEELEGTEIMYKGLVDHAKRMCKAYIDLLQIQHKFGDCFAEIGAREPQQRASEVFRNFGEFHRNMEKDGVMIIRDIKPILEDLGTYLNKAIPDTKLTVKRYADAKFTYLSYCLKVKEMDDEEHGYAAIQEPLYRVETGNYEHRLVLRCRQDARSKFAKLRTDVLEKMELLECKHATDLNRQLKGLVDKLAELHNKIVERIEALPPLFPIEVDFKETDFQYESNVLRPQELDDDELENASSSIHIKRCAPYHDNEILGMTSKVNEVSCGMEVLEDAAPIINIQMNSESQSQSNVDLLAGLGLGYSEDSSEHCNSSKSAIPHEDIAGEDLLKELGLLSIDLSSDPSTTTSDSNPLSLKKNKNTYDFDLFVNQTVAQAQASRDLMAFNATQTDLLLQ